MPAYLSDEWLAAFDAALSAASELRSLRPISIEQLVRAVPSAGDVRYRVWIDADGGHAGRAETAGGACDIRLTTDYATAVAIATGAQNAQIALATGRLQLGGDVDTLTRHAESLSALDDVSAALRTDTTYDEPPDPSP